jgi:hypothetical protein
MEEPRSVIAEMIRVTRSAGRIVASEPDWGTLVLYNGDLTIGTMLCERWKQSFRNPYIGRELGLIFADEGVGEIRREAHALCLTRFEDARIIFDLERVRAEAVKTGALTDGDALRWWSLCEEACGACARRHQDAAASLRP